MASGAAASRPDRQAVSHPQSRPLTRLILALWFVLITALAVLPVLPAAAQLPVLNDVRISARTAVSGDNPEFQYGAHVSGGLGRVVAHFAAENGAGLQVEAENADWGLIVLNIRRGHLDGAYKLESVYLEAASDPDSWAEYNRDGSLRTAHGEVAGGHQLPFSQADFTVSGNGTADRIAPELLWIMRDGAGSYRFVALDDGAGVVGVSIDLLRPDGADTAALTRAPGNRGMASLRLMQGAPTGLYRVRSVTLRDGAVPSNTTTYRRDGTVLSTDPEAPQSHAFALAALDFVWGEDLPPAPELDSLVHEGDGEFSFRASSPRGIGAVELSVRRPDGSIVLARSASAGPIGRLSVPLGGDLPRGQNLIEAVRVTDAADPPVTVEYRRDGTLHGAPFAGAERHELLLWTRDFGWWGGPLRSRTELVLPARVRQGARVTARITVSAVQGTPQGWVHLHAGAQSIAAAELDAQGQARIVLEELEPGTHRLQARYSGSEGFRPSVSENRSVTVTVEETESAGFAGGGVIFAQTEDCMPMLGARSHPVTVHYRPSEFDNPTSSVTIAWPEGSEHLALWGPMNPGSLFMGGVGRSVWGRFVYARQRPLIRVVQRQVTQPENAQIERAQEMLLRLRVQNFGARPGCAVTLSAMLRRTG